MKAKMAGHSTSAKKQPDGGKKRPRRFKKRRRVSKLDWERPADMVSFMARTIYHLAALGYERRHGIKPLPRDLNKEFPASMAKVTSNYAAWNRLRSGVGLPRPPGAPQDMLMRELHSKDPVAWASYFWPIWRLASEAPLALQQVHALMLRLQVGISHMLIMEVAKGRFLRWPTDRLTEIEWMSNEKSLGGLTGMIALIREAELTRDEGIFLIARGWMHSLLPALEPVMSTELAGEFSEFLKHRFSQMTYVFEGAYGTHPGETTSATPPVQTVLDETLREAADNFEIQWKRGASKPTNG